MENVQPVGQNMAAAATNQLEVELIAFNRLKDYQAGKVDAPVETFTINVAGDKAIKTEVKPGIESEAPAEVKKQEVEGEANLGQRLKDIILGEDSQQKGFISEKEKGGKAMGGFSKSESPQALGKEVDVNALLSFVERNRKPLLALPVVILVAGLLVWGAVSINWKNYLGASSSLEQKDTLVGKVIREGRILLGLEVEDNSSQTVSNATPDVGMPGEAGLEETVPGEGSTSNGNGYAGFSIGKILQDNAVEELEFKIAGADLETAGTTKEDIYSFINNSAGSLVPGNIYFLTIKNAEGKEVPFEDFRKLVGIEMMSNWNTRYSEGLKDYRLMIFLDPEQGATSTPIKLGLFVVLGKEATPAIGEMEDWEATMVNDLQPLYFDGNEALLDNTFLFRDSTIEENRRYVNFTADDSLSLDYAAVGDGIVVITSKNFGTSILNLLLEYGS